MGASAGIVEQFCWELRRTFQDLAHAADRELEHLGIGAGDRAILEFLARESDPVSISDLARKTRVSRQYIHQSLRRLPDSGWVEEIHGGEDRRLVLLALTRSGRAFWNRLRKTDVAFFQWLAPRLPAAELRTALKIIRKMRNELHRRDQSRAKETYG